MSRLPALLRRVGRWLWAVLTWRWGDVTKKALIQDTDEDPQQLFASHAVFEHSEGEEQAIYELEAGGVTATIEVSPGSNNLRLRIGPTATPASNRNTFDINADGSVLLGSGNVSVALGADNSLMLNSNTSQVILGADDSITIASSTGVVRVSGLPTADPATADGALWLNSGVLTVST